MPLVFIKLVVDDLPRMAQFYCDAFGMTVLRSRTSNDHTYYQDQMTLSSDSTNEGISLTLVRYLRRPAPPTGAAWTGFTVTDVDVVVDAVEVAGGKVEVPIHGTPGFGTLTAIVSDPEGHLIEVVQMPG